MSLLIFLFVQFFSVHLLFSNNYNCDDYVYSHLKLDFCLEKKSISGSNELHFKSKCHIDTFQIDLVDNLIVDSILFFDQKINFIRKNSKILILNSFDNIDYYVFTVFYGGQPVSSVNPPWTSGFVWDKDSESLDWVGVACQMDGGSIWWPTVTELSDEPDSLRTTFTVQNPYYIVSNGKLEEIKILDSNKRSFTWFVESPINNYNVTFNIANYHHFYDTLNGIQGTLTMDYYILPENSESAKKHFKQINPMMHFFEKKFGPYPFYEDGYKIVETSYLGMEHQSCISYGNQFKPGYLGVFPAEIDFDFILIHETAHEWWGNSVSMKKRKDMWIHEAFATYAEALYVEALYDYDNMLLYLNNQKERIQNKYPLVTDKHLTTDIYYKGSWMLHTLRTVLNNDKIWDGILKGIQHDFKHKTVTTFDVVSYIEKKCGRNLSHFFEQYLFESELPKFEYFISKNRNKYILNFRWNTKVDNFKMPLLVTIEADVYDWIYPKNDWQKLSFSHNIADQFLVAEDLFLIDVKEIKR